MAAGGASSNGKPGGNGEAAARRPRAALFLVLCALAGVAPHALGPWRSMVPSISLALLLGILLMRARYDRSAVTPSGG